jgi:2-polyprenyl-3-methyl-5-hydroxy-6-metoxy-1,4-benzoquinol methylase
MLARMADQTYSGRYADPDEIAGRQLAAVARWGTPVLPGSSVLEIGCADGFSTVKMAKEGYRVTALDASLDMLAAADRRITADGVDVDLVLGDVSSYEPTATFDVVAALMWTFFWYVHDPLPVLTRLAEHARVKLLVDVDPRQTPVATAVDLMRQAGFRSVEWRPLFVPIRYRVPTPVKPVLRLSERTPWLRDALLRRKFVVVVKGEGRS